MTTSDPLALDSAVASAPARRPASNPGRTRILRIGLLWMAAWWAVLGALLAPILPGGWLPVLLVALLAAAPLVHYVLRGRNGDYPGAAYRIWVLRPFFYTQMGLPLLGTIALLGVLLGLPFGTGATAGRWALALGAAGFAAALVAGYLGSRQLQVRRLDARLSDLPAGLEGLRIVQVSDLHVGPHTPVRYLERVKEAIRGSNPDLIAFTGDQVDDYARDVVPFGAAFGDLAAPLGVYAIAGNHDVYAGWPAVQAGLEGLGIRVLVNEAIELEHRGGRFWLAGTGDPAATNLPRHRGGEAAPHIGRTLARVPDGATTLALAHNPALWPQLAERNVALTLSGHTHHGQLSIPKWGWSLASPFLEHAMGVHRKGDSLLYINPGTNYWGLPFRIGALPEVTVLTLRAAAAGKGYAELIGEAPRLR
jgi:predicted MPP superfamily phosphohydrolase